MYIRFGESDVRFGAMPAGLIIECRAIWRANGDLARLQAAEQPLQDRANEIALPKVGFGPLSVSNDI